MAEDTIGYPTIVGAEVSGVGMMVNAFHAFFHLRSGGRMVMKHRRKERRQKNRQQHHS